MSKETNLTSLKVYGNDDPAGSVYKVSEGDEGTNGGVFMCFQTYDGPTNSTYLVDTKGSPVSVSQLVDARVQGMWIGFSFGFTSDQMFLSRLSDSDRQGYSATFASVYLLNGQPSMMVKVFTAESRDGQLKLQV